MFTLRGMVNKKDCSFHLHLHTRGGTVVSVFFSVCCVPGGFLRSLHKIKREGKTSPCPERLTGFGSSYAVFSLLVFGLPKDKNEPQ